MIDYAQYIKHCPPAAVQFAGAMGIDVTDEVQDPFFPLGPPDFNLGNKKEKKKNKSDVNSIRDHDLRMPTRGESLLCPGFVEGFALNENCWAQFRVDRLKDINWNDTAYGLLEMDEEKKQVISALVESHRKHSKFDSEEFDDIIAGKGLVFLLQGPPGLGNTLTAGMLIAI